MRRIHTFAAAAALIASALLPGRAPAAERRPVILLDVQYAAASDQEALGGTRTVNPRLAIVTERLTAHLAAAPDFHLIANPAVSAELSNYNLGACGRCELILGRKAGAEVVAVASVQEVSAMLINLQVFLITVADGAIIGAGGTVIHSDTDADWRRAIDYIAEKRLKLPAVD